MFDADDIMGSFSLNVHLHNVIQVCTDGANLVTSPPKTYANCNAALYGLNSICTSDHEKYLEPQISHNSSCMSQARSMNLSWLSAGGVVCCVSHAGTATQLRFASWPPLRPYRLTALVY